MRYGSDMSSGDDGVRAAMGHCGSVLRSVTSSVHDEARALAALRDAAEAALAERLEEIERTKAYVAEDASSAATWARRELHQDARRTRQLIRAAATMRELPLVGESARAGRISADHVARFSFALAHVDEAEVRRIEAHLVAVSEAHPPSRVKSLVDRLRSIVHAEELDDAWIAGADKSHLSLNALPDGWHVTGFLPIDVGAKLKAVLDAVSTPREGGDRRSASERRLDGLDHLLTRVLAEGLPTDGTVRPQLHVLVDAGSLQRALAPGTRGAFEPDQPAVLEGFGHIGANLLAHLTCGADLIPVLVDRIGPNRSVLDVGRRHRDATQKQRHAVWIQQDGRCATEHCRNTVDHVHHRRRWSDGGPTDLANLVGLCSACHCHEHRHDVALARTG